MMAAMALAMALLKAHVDQNSKLSNNNAWNASALGAAAVPWAAAASSLAAMEPGTAGSSLAGPLAAAGGPLLAGDNCVSRIRASRSIFWNLGSPLFASSAADAPRAADNFSEVAVARCGWASAAAAVLGSFRGVSKEELAVPWAAAASPLAGTASPFCFPVRRRLFLMSCLLRLIKGLPAL